MYPGPRLSNEKIATLEAFAPVWVVAVDGKKLSGFSVAGLTRIELLPGPHKIEVAYRENNDGTMVVPGGRVHYSSRVSSKQNAVLDFDAKAGSSYVVLDFQFGDRWEPEIHGAAATDHRRKN